MSKTEITKTTAMRKATPKKRVNAQIDKIDKIEKLEEKQNVSPIVTKVQIGDEEIKDSTAVLKFKESWKIKRAQKIKKWVFTLFMIASFVVAFYFVFLSMGIDILDAFRSEGSAQTAFDIEGGLWIAAVAFIGLFVMESLTMNIIPGTTTVFVTIIATHIFDGRLWVTFIVVVIGMVLSSLALYVFGRYIGRRILFWLFDKEGLEKKLDWVARNGTKGVPWLFLIPFFPTDLMCIACGASKMKFWHFFLIVMVFRPIEVLLLLSYSVIIPFVLEQDFIIQVLVVNIVIIDIFLLVIYHRGLLRLFDKGINVFNFKKKYESALAIAIAQEKERLEKEQFESENLNPEMAEKKIIE